jgi:type I restriction enzyme M protein
MVGMELDGSLHIVALARILLSGDIQPEMRIGNTLAEPAHVEDDAERFDCILANLPFGIRQPKEVFSKYPIHTSASESLFIQHMLSRLRHGGRAVVAIPENFLFRRGADVNLRRRLLESYAIESVWSVPPEALTGSSGLKTSILVIRNDGPREEVIFVRDKLVKPFLDEESNIPTGFNTAKSRWVSAWASEIRANVGLSTFEVSPRIENVRLLSALPSMVTSMEHLRQADTQLSDLVTRIPVKELAERDWELLPKRTGVEQLQAFFSALREHLGQIELATLSEIADVFSGISYQSEELIRVKDDKNLSFPKISKLFLADSQSDVPIGVRLVRVQDVGTRKQEKERSSAIKRPPVFLRSSDFSKIPSEQRLQVGDILLTRSGTVGVLGLVDEGLADAIAAKGIVVIRPKYGYNPLALLRILQTGPYQDWFQGNALGSVTQHLSIQSVRQLIIPRFDHEQQQRLTDVLLAGDNIDALLREFQAWTGESPWAALLLHDPNIESLLKPIREDGYPAEWWKSLRSVIDECARLDNRGIPEDNMDQAALNVAAWVRRAGRLMDAMDLPAGLERYAALKTLDWAPSPELWPTNGRSEDELQATSLQSQISERFDSLCKLLMSAAESEANRIADSATLGVELQVRSTILGRTTDLPILLINRGTGPLSKLVISIPELEWRVQIPLLRAEDSRQIALAFKSEHRGRQQIHVLWKAERINGTSVEGRDELSFDVSPIELTAENPFEVNPYVTGAPVDTEGTFFGREDVIDRIHRLLRVDGPSTVILVEGNRRAGKTSILKRLQKSEQLLEEWVPVYCQFQGMSGEPNAQSLYRLVAREILNAVAGTPSGTVPEQLRTIVQARSPLERISLCSKLAASVDKDRPFERFEELLQLALEASKPKRILLMLDEFEKIHQGIEQRQMSPLVPENFRYIFQTYPGISGILSGSIRIKRLRKEYWNVLFGIGTPIPVGPLRPAAARELVIRPAQGILNYSNQAIDRVLELCAFQPFLIQSLASAVFEACATSNLSSVTTDLVNQSAHALTLSSEHFYTVFRQQSLTARQRFLACLIDSLTNTSTRVTFDVIRDQLENQGVPALSDLQLKADLEDLQEREIIAFLADTPGGHYRIEVPLFSQWLRAKVDFQAERSEAIEE